MKLPLSSALRSAVRLRWMAQSAASLAPSGSTPLFLDCSAIVIHISACSKASCSSWVVRESDRLDDWVSPRAEEDPICDDRPWCPPPAPPPPPLLEEPNPPNLDLHPLDPF
eukprot:CAMPEP_0113557156 /NCGR_PEP_ID=MMETSP0015_2-20120614/17636_1 /TAXON_ID=2838 /ORGANISM="Odontella" /LENGTH=110 /DNA_ID=CAMNT_0000458553 /DNA_START=116 /DNA_END=445 /DNA_ORIENTATION=- /assembly_acc=CAM_ASM_000160